MDTKLINNKDFIHYLVEFHATRDYFECHEIMEEYWKSQPQNEWSDLWVACIQIAVAQYHDRRKNSIGAKRMYESALTKFKSYVDLIKEIDLQHLCRTIEARLTNFDLPYYDFNFIINDKEIVQACDKLVQQRQLVWGRSSTTVSIDIIERHKRRDRSEVIAERQASLKAKQLKRKGDI